MVIRSCDAIVISLVDCVMRIVSDVTFGDPVLSTIKSWIASGMTYFNKTVVEAVVLGHVLF